VTKFETPISVRELRSCNKGHKVQYIINVSCSLPASVCLSGLLYTGWPTNWYNFCTP